jgi:hypothetical protein
VRLSENKLLRAFDDAPINGQELIDNPEQYLESRLNTLAPVNRDVAMKNFLQNLRIGDRALPRAYEFFERPLYSVFL